LLDAGIPLAQRCAHGVAQLYGQLSLNDENGDVRPSVAWVADRLGYTRRQVQRAHKMLEEAGFWQAVGRYARRVIRRITALVKTAAPAPTPAPTKGDMGSPSKVTWGHRTNDAPYSFKRSDKPTPVPPPFVPTPATGSSPELRAKLRTGWRNLAKRGDRS